MTSFKKGMQEFMETGSHLKHHHLSLKLVSRRRRRFDQITTTMIEMTVLAMFKLCQRLSKVSGTATCRTLKLTLGVLQV
jgi:hypothetical protein